MLESRASYIFEALPAGGSGANIPTMRREMIPFVEEHASHRFPWPPDSNSRPLLPGGTSNLQVSVLDVGAPILGERVTLYIAPPVTFKGCDAGYTALWWFYLWPVYTCLLLIYLVALLWKSRRKSTLE